MSARLVALCALLLSGAGCVAYLPPPLPEVHDREPRALRIFVVADDWQRAAALALELQKAGFVPALVASETQLPAGAPWIGNVESAVHEDDGCPNPLNYITAWTFGVLPVFNCESFGARFELHRVRGAVAQTIDTRWEVPVLYGWFVWPMAVFPGWRARAYFLPPGLAGDYPVRALRADVLGALDDASAR